MACTAVAALLKLALRTHELPSQILSDLDAVSSSYLHVGRPAHRRDEVALLIPPWPTNCLVTSAVGARRVLTSYRGATAAVQLV